jgi:DUF177 domain-containing protein
MLSFDLRSLAWQAVLVDADLDPMDAVWDDGDTRPATAVHVTGRLSHAGVGRFYFSGHIDGKATTSCRRCLADVEQQVDADTHLLFAEPSAEAAEDPDVYLIDPHAHDLDLAPAIREEWLLAVPAFAVCREDCQGLCPRCGGDRNIGACTCASSTDSRRDALRPLRDAAH